MRSTIGARSRVALLGASLALAVGASSAVTAQEAIELPDVTGLSGEIRIDGSSTVFPVTEAIAEEFQNYTNQAVRVTVAESGTSGGFQKFCRGETDANDASRPIKEEEVVACAELGIEAVELPVAYDGLSIVVHPDNDWVDCITVEELNAIWDTGSEITNWSQVREGFPDRPLENHLYGAGADSGTFDYFTEEINGDTGVIRTDYNPSEDDNVTIVGVEGDPGAAGFLGLSYVLENEGRIRALQIDGGGGCVEPSAENVISGSYVPLGRPLFIYFKAESLQRPEVAAFAQYYADNQATITAEALFIPLSEEQAVEQQAELDAIIGG